MCIYLADEFVLCFKDRKIDLTSNNNKECLDWKKSCPDKITIEDVSKMKSKLEACESLVQKWRRESQRGNEGAYKSVPDIGYSKCADKLEKALNPPVRKPCRYLKNRECLKGITPVGSCADFECVGIGSKRHCYEKALGGEA